MPDASAGRQVRRHHDVVCIRSPEGLRRMPPSPIEESRPIPLSRPTPIHQAATSRMPPDPCSALSQRAQAAVTRGSIPPEPGPVPGNHAA